MSADSSVTTAKPFFLNFAQTDHKANSVPEDYFKKLEEKYPPFDISTWVPPSVKWRHLSVKILWRTDLEDLYKMPTTDELVKGNK